MQFIEYYLASTVTECNLTNDHLFSKLVSATTGTLLGWSLFFKYPKHVNESL